MRTYIAMTCLLFMVYICYYICTRRLESRSVQYSIVMQWSHTHTYAFLTLQTCTRLRRRLPVRTWRQRRRHPPTGSVCLRPAVASVGSPASASLISRASCCGSLSSSLSCSHCRVWGAAATSRWGIIANTWLIITIIDSSQAKHPSPLTRYLAVIFILKMAAVELILYASIEIWKDRYFKVSISTSLVSRINEYWFCHFVRYLCRSWAYLNFAVVTE